MRCLKREQMHGPNMAFVGLGEVVLSRISWCSDPSIKHGIQRQYSPPGIGPGGTVLILQLESTGGMERRQRGSSQGDGKHLFGRVNMVVTGVVFPYEPLFRSFSGERPSAALCQKRVYCYRITVDAGYVTY